MRDEVVEPLAAEGLEHDGELGVAHDLVGAHEMRMRELEQQLALALEPRDAAARGVRQSGRSTFTTHGQSRSALQTS